MRPRPEETNERNYALIAELYQHLKKNYDDRRDYWTAGDFHHGEMETKRLYSSSRRLTMGWLHRHVGLAAWYRYVSEYGESYVRPVLWLLSVILLFSFLYPAVGLRCNLPNASTAGQAAHAAPSPVVERLSYRNRCPESGKGPSSGCLTGVGLLGRSLWTAVQLAAFQKDIACDPDEPWGRVLALAEVLLTSTLVALFLLAVRRQFRR